MLNIYLGNMENVIFHPPTYFDNTYEDEWITDPLSVEMIKDVDKSVVVSSHLIDSPVLGPIPPVNLSGGVKTLMLMAFDTNNRVFNASSCGDNCAKWTLQIASQKDLTINLRHIIDFGRVPFEAKILNISVKTCGLPHLLQSMIVHNYLLTSLLSLEYIIFLSKYCILFYKPPS